MEFVIGLYIGVLVTLIAYACLKIVNGKGKENR